MADISLVKEDNSDGQTLMDEKFLSIETNKIGS